jgi:hypothetical protein
MAVDAAAGWEKIIGTCRRHLARWLRGSAESRQTVAEILESLEELDRLYRLSVRAQTEARQPAVIGERRPSRRDLSKRFQVERTHRGLFLAEHFSSTRLPFRCPEAIYFAVVKVLESARAPVSFDVVLQKVRAASKDPLPDYLVRVCIRFWLATKPPLIEKVRACYRPLHPTRFAREAKRVWDKLAARAD